MPAVKETVIANGGPSNGTLVPAWDAWNNENGKKGKAAACNEALNNLRRASRVSRFDDPASDEEKKVELDFLQLCLGPVSEPVAQRIARVTINGSIACTALLTAPMRALTARHCLFTNDSAQKENAKLSPVVTDLSNVYVEFGSIASPGRVRVKAVAIGMQDSTPRIIELKTRTGEIFLVERAQVENDTMGLLLASEAASGPLDPIIWTSPNFGDRVYLPAYFAPTYLEGLKDEHGFRQQEAGICQIVEPNKAGRCLRHGCATTPAASGAPIFVQRVRDGKSLLALAGVHTSGSREESGCPGNPLLDGILNFGIAIQDSELDYLQGRR